LSLELQVSVRERMEALRDETNADSITEVIRRALSVYEMLGNAANEGGQLIVEFHDHSSQVLLPEFGGLRSSKISPSRSAKSQLRVGSSKAAS
jgi:hypothetical protein